MSDFTGYDVLNQGEDDHAALTVTEQPFRCGDAGGRKHQSMDPRKDLRMEMQFSLSSCTGNALTTGMELIWGLQAGSFAGVPQLSRWWAYIKGQTEFGNVGRDSGCGIAAIVKAMSTVGCVTEAQCPYPQRYTTRLPPLEREAGAIKIGSHAMCKSYEQAIEWLDGIGAIDFGSIWTKRMAACKGVLDLADVREDGSRGGHSFAGVGFTASGNLIVANSHSERWGRGGYAEMTPDAFAYLLTRPYSVIAMVSDLSGVARQKRNVTAVSDWARD